MDGQLMHKFNLYTSKYGSLDLPSHQHPNIPTNLIWSVLSQICMAQPLSNLGLRAWRMWGKIVFPHTTLTATDLTALMSFLLSKFFKILLSWVIWILLLNRMSLIQIPARTQEVENCINNLEFKFHYQPHSFQHYFMLKVLFSIL